MSQIAVARRAEQSAALQKGLAFSAGFHLTLAVLLFGVIGVMRTLPPPPPPDEDPFEEHRVLDPRVFDDDIDTGGAPEQTVVDVPPDVAEIDPVEDEDLIVDVPVAPARDTDGPTPNEGLIGRPGGTGSGSGQGPGGEESDPDPNDPQIFDIEPEAIRRVLPIYPDIARQIGQEGEVMVRVLVGKDGAVRNVEMQKSSAMFDDAALVAVRQWTFRPAIWQGRPVAVWVRIPIRFRMN